MPFFSKSLVLYRIVKPFSGAIQNAITELHSCPGSQVMTRNVNVFVAARARFIYKIIYEKWAKIESKTAIKCFKNVQISYNLDLICISSGFINWQKIVEKY